ncbi:MAG: nucleoside triphosphate pyrophosphohydrolase [Actinobacteria bacterium]|nr:nucleoside triphosphate pyrophosphohydrolase [Actinomycetota bacterium]
MKAQVTIVGLGPGAADSVTRQTLDAINSSQHRYVRTMRHPSAFLVGDATSFDDEYEKHEKSEDVYRAIAEKLKTEAEKHRAILYAVPGSPLVLEQTVQHLLHDESIETVLISAMSFLDVAWQVLRIDPVDAGVRLIDGHRFARLAAGESGPLLVAQCHANWVLSEIKLAHESATGDEPVVILHHLGLKDQQVVTTTWKEMDRTVEPDHLTSIYIPKLANSIAGEMTQLHGLARTLREQCPWDKAQTHKSLVRYLIEETYEVVDAITSLDPNDESSDEKLIEELGDLLYQVEFHAIIAEQQGRFSIADVARSIHDKLVRRHPHVFGDFEAETPDAVASNWESLKKQERDKTNAKTVFEGVAKSAPSLMYSTKLQKRAAELGFDWPNKTGASEKIAEELRELVRAIDSAGAPDEIPLELGDVLFSVVNLSRHIGVDAESALRSAAEKFRRRFEAVVALAQRRDLQLEKCTLAQLDALWDEVKKADKK